VIDLLGVIKDFSLPTKVVNVLNDTENLPFDHPAKDKTRKDDKATAYLCTGPTCSLPANSPAEFRKLLEERTENAAT